MKTPKEIDPSDLKPISDLINLVYTGILPDMRDDFYLIIYLLHYVDKEYISTEEVERGIYILHELSKSLQQIHNKLNE